LQGSAELQFEPGGLRVSGREPAQQGPLTHFWIAMVIMAKCWRS
jgi:hypothetical protein